MKKNYLKPEVISLNVLCENIIATSPGGTTVGGGADPDEEAGVNRGRGEWGNVWGGGSN